MSHCYFTRLNLKKIGPLQFCLLALLGTHRNPKQKYFLKSCEGFLRAILTGQGHSVPVWKTAKMAKWLYLKCYESVIVWLYPETVLIWEDKLDYLKNPSCDFKNYFCLVFLWIPSNVGRQNQISETISLRLNMVK